MSEEKIGCRLAKNNMSVIEELHHKIIELEQKESRDYDNINELRRQISVNDDQIEKLEKELIKEDGSSWVDAIMQTQYELQKELSSLKTEINNNTELTREFNRKRVKEIKELKEQYTELDGILAGNLEETFDLQKVLRELFKKFEDSHDESIHRKFFTGLLDKLGGEKTVVGGVIRGHETNGKQSLRESDSKPPNCERCRISLISKGDQWYCVKCRSFILKENTSEQTECEHVNTSEFPFWKCGKCGHIEFYKWTRHHILVEKADLEFAELRDEIDILIKYVDQYTHITPSHRAIQILIEFKAKYLSGSEKND